MTLQTNDKIKRSQDIKISSVVIMVMLDMGKEFVLNNTYELRLGFTAGNETVI